MAGLLSTDHPSPDSYVRVPDEDGTLFLHPDLRSVRQPTPFSSPPNRWSRSSRFRSVYRTVEKSVFHRVISLHRDGDEYSCSIRSVGLRNRGVFRQSAIFGTPDQATKFLKKSFDIKEAIETVAPLLSVWEPSEESSWLLFLHYLRPDNSSLFPEALKNNSSALVHQLAGQLGQFLFELHAHDIDTARFSTYDVDVAGSGDGPRLQVGDGSSLVIDSSLDSEQRRITLAEHLLSIPSLSRTDAVRLLRTYWNRIETEHQPEEEIRGTLRETVQRRRVHRRRAFERSFCTGPERKTLRGNRYSGVIRRLWKGNKKINRPDELYGNLKKRFVNGFENSDGTPLEESLRELVDPHVPKDMEVFCTSGPSAKIEELWGMIEGRVEMGLQWAVPVALVRERMMAPPCLLGLCADSANARQLTPTVLEEDPEMANRAGRWMGLWCLSRHDECQSGLPDHESGEHDLPLVVTGTQDNRDIRPGRLLGVRAPSRKSPGDLLKNRSFLRLVRSTLKIDHSLSGNLAGRFTNGFCRAAGVKFSFATSFRKKLREPDS